VRAHALSDPNPSTRAQDDQLNWSLDPSKKASGVSNYFRDHLFTGRPQDSRPIDTHLREYNICSLQMGFEEKDKARFLINS